MCNFISNTCVGGHLYKECIKTDFKNPFVWSLMLPNDFIRLIKEYKTINFKNIKLKYISKHKYYDLIIDDKINVYYVHYLKDDGINESDKAKNNVYLNKIEDYIIEKYTSRLEKMKDDPIYILAGGKFANHRYTDEDIQTIVDIVENPIIILLDEKHKIPNTNKKFVYLLIREHAYTKYNTIENAKYIYDYMNTVLKL